MSPVEGAAFGHPFIFPQITIAKPDSSFVVAIGRDASSISDSLFVAGDGLLNDTAIRITSGTLDARSGLIWSGSGVRDISHGPFVSLSAGARLRSSRIATYDSLSVPYLLLDSLSAIEYSGDDVMDGTYLTNNILGHAYGDLRLAGGVVLGLKYADLHVRHNLYLQSGASLSPDQSTGGPNPEEYIFIKGDVVNENGGESGSSGAGLRGDGMIAQGHDHWIFEGAGDTTHWSGPSEVSLVTIKAALSEDHTPTVPARMLE